MTDFIWIAIALPFAGALLLHFFGRRLGEPGAGYVASLAMIGSFGWAALNAWEFVAGTGEPHVVELFEWIPAIGANAELLWDPLSALMTLIVTGVGTLIHIYSIGYMHGDERFSRFFAYLNLFAGSMLLLVLANNFGLLFVGWELVGLCSYLLISFWFTRESAAKAGKKAFVVNRVGDFGFMVALMLIFVSFGTLSFTEVLHDPGEVISAGMAAAIGLLLLVGATGKSAQIPLYVWLPDAMEGPTPVSALIHAATMVTAGVYMVARAASIFDLSPEAALVVSIVGALTALIAGTIAVAQTDIKRVLAYSTVSQLGYMFIAAGAAGYVASVFHLMTHAFFKGLLFLGAGSVIHAMSDEQNMHKMGGLLKVMPVTGWTMAIATLAIAGIPPLSGFWSKDEILAVTFEAAGFYYMLWAIGIITALLTAFYMTRQFVLVFLGKPRWDQGVEPHESPRTMTVPLLVLAVLTAVAGFVNTPFRLGLEHFLEPSFEGVALAQEPELAVLIPLAVVSVLAGVAGAAIALVVYLGPVGVRTQWYLRVRRSWEWLRRGYGVDEFYDHTIVQPGRQVATWAAFTVDQKLVDGAVNGVGVLVRRIGASLRPFQTGFVRNYALALAVGAVGVAVWLVLARGI